MTMGRTAALLAALMAGAGAIVGLAPAPAAAAAPILVPRDYPTVQAAVDAAPPGGTIRVAGGTYTEEVVVGKDLTVLGDGAATTVIKAPASLRPYGVHLPDGRELTAIVRIWGGAHVRVSGLTVTGPIPCGVEVTGVHAPPGRDPRPLERGGDGHPGRSRHVPAA